MDDKRNKRQHYKAPGGTGCHKKGGKHTFPKGKHGIEEPNKPYGEHEVEGVPDRNDWEFYALDENIAKDFGSWPYNILGGQPAPVSVGYFGTTAASGNTTTITKSVPFGVMRIDIANSIGISTARTDAINMAATQLYTFVRHANSGAKIYEPADLMMYIIAMSDIYAGFFELRRALGIVQYYPLENRHAPETILYALGIDAADLRSNLANYRGRFNLLAEKINSWAVPKYFKAFLRRAYISNNVFADSTSVRGQWYVFRRSIYYTFSPATSTTGTELVAGDIFDSQSNVRTFGDLLTIVENQLNALFLDEDANTMSGDILKAFSMDALYQVEGISSDFIQAPVFDEDILAQIENSVALTSSTLFLQYANDHSNSFKDLLNITQSNQLITFAPTVVNVPISGGSGFMNLQSYVFNSHKDTPDYRDNLEWSRLITVTAATKSTGSAAAGGQIVACGLELVLSYTKVTSVVATDGTLSFTQVQFRNTYSVAPPSSLFDVEQFDWHPIIYIYPINSSGVATGSMTIGADLKKWTVVSNVTVEATHKSANAASFYARDVYRHMQRDYNK